MARHSFSAFLSSCCALLCVVVVNCCVVGAVGVGVLFGAFCSMIVVVLFVM